MPIYFIGGGNTVMEHFSDDSGPAGTSGKPALVIAEKSSAKISQATLP